MKVGIVGTGFVGSTAAYAMVMQGIGREIVLVDANAERAVAEAADIQHAVPFAAPLQVRAGQYADLQGARVVILTAGVNQQPGETRLQLLQRNSQVFRSIVPQVLAAAPETVLLVASNPVDIMTHLTAEVAAELGAPRNRVFGSGTTLDTARFRALIAQHVGIDPHHVHGYVLGEHGDSEVLAWSTVHIAGLPLAEFCAARSIPLNDEIRQTIDVGVRRAAYSIIAGKRATYYGIGSALARIVNVVLHDQRSILTVCSPHQRIGDVEDVTLSLPHLIGGPGVLGEIPVQLSSEERVGLAQSAGIIRAAIASLAGGV